MNITEAIDISGKVLAGLTGVMALTVGGYIYSLRNALNEQKIANQKVLEQYDDRGNNGEFVTDGVLTSDQSRAMIFGEYDTDEPKGVISIGEGQRVVNGAKFYSHERTGGSLDTERNILEALRLIDSEQQAKVVGDAENVFRESSFFVTFKTDLTAKEVEKLDIFNDFFEDDFTVRRAFKVRPPFPEAPHQYFIDVLTRISDEEVLARIQKSTAVERVTCNPSEDETVKRFMQDLEIRKQETKEEINE